jgi:6-phosphofructokinase 1
VFLLRNNNLLKMKEIKTVGILTSGGDAPGMNACVRAVTRAAIYNGWKVMGIYRGYEGLINGEIKELTTESVSNTIQRGGTLLKTARSQAFMTPEGRKKAYDNVVKFGLGSLIIIGGNGSLAGAQDFANEYDISVIGLPGTIDNDLCGTDSTIGYDTALNTIVECVDKIRDTATSHDRIFFVEVMGRDAGFLAQNSAIASGAEAAIIPEDKTDKDQLEQFISRGFRKSKNSSIVIVSESQKDGGAMHYAERVRKEYPQYDVRVTILGHLQRGGTPSAYDRILASRLGYASIEALKEGQRNVMIGISNNQIVYVPINRAIKMNKPIDKELINILTVLSI